MNELIAPCGNNCVYCSRYTAKTNEELQRAAELWFKVGWSEKIFSSEEVKCSGCSNHRILCTLINCLNERNFQKCNQCSDFPCDKIKKMLERSKEYEKQCKELCSDIELMLLKKAFFEKEENLKIN